MYINGYGLQIIRYKSGLRFRFLNLYYLNQHIIKNENFNNEKENNRTDCWSWGCYGNWTSNILYSQLFLKIPKNYFKLVQAFLEFL